MNTPPQQEPEKYEFRDRQHNLTGSTHGGGINGTRVAIGGLMLLGGIVLSAAGTGRVFIGLIVMGAISLIAGLAGK